jgi:hypothetical protein
MPAIISEKFRIFNAKQFVESLDEAVASTIYFFIGAPRVWYGHMEIYGQNAQAFTVGMSVTSTGGFSATVKEVYPYSLFLENVVGTPTPGATLTGTGGTPPTAKIGVYRSGDENNPPNVFDNQDEKYATYRDIIALKKVTNSDVKHVIRRYNYNVSLYPAFDMWRPDYSALNTSYTGASSLATSRYIIMNNNYEVFMCLYNGAGVDGSNNIVKGQNMTYVPQTGLDGTGNTGKYTPYSGGAINSSGGIYAETDSSGNVLAGTAGYIWKHLFTIPTSDVIKFVSTDFIPVVLDSTVQGVAAVDGAIQVAVLKDRGSGLPTTFFAPVIGDTTATQAVVKCTTSSGQITKVEMVGKGAGYTWGEVYLKHGYMYSTYNAGTNTLSGQINSGYANATGRVEVIIPPQGGYGKDPIVETNAKRVMVNVRLEGLDGVGDFPVDNDFRRIGLLQDPLASGGSALTSNTASGLNVIKVTGLSAGQTYTPDEKITQTVSGGQAIGTVVSYRSIDNTSGYIYYFQTPELHRDSTYSVRSFVTNTAVLGASSASNGTVDNTYGVVAPEVKVNTGEMMYVENRRFISRAADQIEDVKLVVEF